MRRRSVAVRARVSVFFLLFQERSRGGDRWETRVVQRLMRAQPERRGTGATKAHQALHAAGGAPESRREALWRARESERERERAGQHTVASARRPTVRHNARQKCPANAHCPSNEQCPSNAHCPASNNSAPQMHTAPQMPHAPCSWTTLVQQPPVSDCVCQPVDGLPCSLWRMARSSSL